MIEVSPGGSTMITGGHIAVYRWVTIKHALRLEKLGMRHSHGAIRPRVASELGLKPRDSYDKFEEAVKAKIEACRLAADGT
jgi:hypothetical protein